MGSPNLAQQQQASPVVPHPVGSIERATGVLSYNGDPRGPAWDYLARAHAMQGMTASVPPAPPRYQARTSVDEAVVRSIADKIVAALPPTAAIKIQGVTVIHGGGEPPKVEVSFFGKDRHAPFTLPLTDDFPSEADISLILLAMP